MNEEILLEDTETFENDSFYSESDYLEDETFAIEVDNLDSSESILDFDEESSTESLETFGLESSEFMNDDSDPNVTGATIVQYDYSETLSEMNVSLTVIVMVLLFWFGMWCMEKWRAWTVKGGK